jgi:hypothetical protein
LARQIILLETQKAGDGITNVNCVFWITITAPTAQVPKAGFTSAAAQLSGAQAITTTEQASLDSGAMREEVLNVVFSASDTTAQMKAELQRRYTDRVAAVNALPPTRAFYGVSFDGTAWSA